MEKREFNIAFQLSKMILFEVSYITIPGNKTPHFSTSAEEFIRSKSDFCRCGQAQEILTKGFPEVRNFYKKWDKYHLNDLTQEQYVEMIADLKELMEKYNFVEYSGTYFIPFHMLVELSKLTPKSQFKTIEKWQKYMDDKKSGTREYDVINKINIW